MTTRGQVMQYGNQEENTVTLDSASTRVLMAIQSSLKEIAGSLTKIEQHLEKMIAKDS